jgi:Transposase DDE domain
MVVHVKSAPLSPFPSPFVRELVEALPLADAFYSLWGSVANDLALAGLFDRHRGRCYQDLLTFAELVGVLLDALTRSKGSGRKAVGHAHERGQLSCKGRAVYRKLARLPLPLAEAFLAELTAPLRCLFPPGRYRSQLPACVRGLSVVVLDGKKIKDAAKRLLACRGLPGKLFGGKVLAAYLPAEGLVVALAADPDGEANDVRLLPRAVELARQAVAGPRLWVADAQFCDLDQPGEFCREQGDHFLVRFTRRNGFQADPARPARQGRAGAGRRYTEEWGWMGSEGDKRRIYVRRVTLERPGEEAVALVTDLLEADEHPAEDLLEIYLTRWQIENVFQQVTEVFGLSKLIGSAPAATVFQAAMCLVIYNMLQVLRGYVAAGRPAAVPLNDISSENLFESLTEELLSLQLLQERKGWIDPSYWCGSDEQTRAKLARLSGLWSQRWQKAANKKRRAAKEKAKQSGAHTSVHKVLQQAKQDRRAMAPLAKN